MSTLQEAVATATAAVVRLYQPNAVPDKPTYPYGVLSASLGRGVAYTLEELEKGRDGRVVCQHFGRTRAAADDHAEQTRDALVGKWLVLTGYAPALVRSELDPTPVGRDPDDNGVVTVTATYTLTAIKEQP